MFDAHLHLQDARFDTCRDAVIAAAAAAGVRGACCCGAAPDDWKAVAALGRFPRSSFSILPAFGAHPWFADPLPPDWMERLESFLALRPDAPVGEIGLDGIRARPSREIQRRVLVAQLEIAVRLRRPVVLHGARAWGELLAVLRPLASRLPGFVGHAFGGSSEVLRDWVALGGFLSFAGTVCNPMAARVRAAVAATPADRLLIETDAPDGMPAGLEPEEARRSLKHGIPEGINHPALLTRVCRSVAQLRKEPVAATAELTRENALRFFGVLRVTS